MTSTFSYYEKSPGALFQREITRSGLHENKIDNDSRSGSIIGRATRARAWMHYHQTWGSGLTSDTKRELTRMHLVPLQFDANDDDFYLFEE